MNSHPHQNEAGPGRGISNSRGVSQAMGILTETFGLSRTVAAGVLLFITLVMVATISWSIYSAPPKTLVITSGPPGSTYQRTAEKYRDLLASNGVAVKILPSQGSTENLQRLGNPDLRVDVGFVQSTGDITNAQSAPLYSLGSIAYQPLMIFCRCSSSVTLLSDLAGKRLAIGPAGSGTRAVATTLLQTNGIVPGGSTALLDLDADEAARALLDGKIDAVFLMGDSAPVQTMRTLLRSPGVQMFDCVQADAYTRRFGYLNKLSFPRGSMDFGKDIPPHDVTLLGPTVELVARANLHPALVDLLLDAAREVHGKATLLQRQGEFPAPLERAFKISPEAGRYYKSGKSFMYRSLPFWLASLLNRVLMAFVPMVLVLIPGLRLVPIIYKWRTQLRIYRWYRNLLRVERDLSPEPTDARREELRRRLAHIERSVNQMKVPASFAGQFYGLREHIGFVRDRIENGTPELLTQDGPPGVAR